jgi:hypothetical protein
MVIIGRLSYNVVKKMTFSANPSLDGHVVMQWTGLFTVLCIALGLQDF